jgi:uncharacterized membrane protein YbhN (UPF0104 family)
MKKTLTGNRWLYWLKLGVGIVLLVILYQHINASQSILTTLKKANTSNIAAVLFLLSFNIGLAFAKWRFLLKKYFTNIHNRDVFGSLLFGYTLGLMTPGNLGELARALFFTNEDKLTITGLNVLDKAANQVIIFTLGTLSLLVLIFYHRAWSLHEARWLLIFGGLALLIVWTVLLHPKLLKSLIQTVRKQLPATSRRYSMLRVFDAFTYSNILILLLMSFCWYSVVILQYHVLINAFTDIAFDHSFLSVSAMLFAKTLLPITFGDLGIREGAAVFFYGLFNVPEAAVFNTALIIFLINFLLPALGGSFYLFKLREYRNQKSELTDTSVKMPNCKKELN